MPFSPLLLPANHLHSWNLISLPPVTSYETLPLGLGPVWNLLLMFINFFFFLEKDDVSITKPTSRPGSLYLTGDFQIRIINTHMKQEKALQPHACTDIWVTPQEYTKFKSRYRNSFKKKTGNVYKVRRETVLCIHGTVIKNETFLTTANVCK